MESIRIDLFADIACPWCYIGERRLEQALEQRPDLSVEWHWHPFQLQPDMPKEGLPWSELIDRKFGGAARARGMFEQVASAGAGDGLEFRFDKVASAPNTLDAHRLVLLAELSGRAKEMAMALFAAYFTEGKNLNDRDTLVAIGSSVGIAEAELHAYLESEVGAEEVAVSQAEAERIGITGVPFFIFNGRFAVSGAQPVAMFLQVIDRALAEKEGAAT